ncbi:NADPH-dependent 7-cyano-7-deazaguanine reductase QueF [Lysobacter sp. HDW10]|jgi:7-cyano-7-deazaguanine reductase|uniref:NADPH-dependent 7-cyano-7-deazaguanine reductase QueF n=1 Tax=Lysobacter sp. HDW10 TaxID=2714936 RepID=UPI00140D4271|nr:NADPH-dependent 7-cyano-7-deazaguanine reductase QueF [Lysobacter sp. HDW10]QIK80831.1 NADPH-dependent 7-cyano-7-deazaguanine reductase QueF [Lysobacter sp. HDW10]
MNSHTPESSQLGRGTAYPTAYDETLLFPIPRSQARDEIGIHGALPFIGHDVWNAYELSWLDAQGKPIVDTAQFIVPATSPNLIESKSFKLYLNSLNSANFASHEAVQARVTAALSKAAGAPVTLRFGVPHTQEEASGSCIDDLPVTIKTYGPPDARLLKHSAADVSEVLFSRLLKSNCPVTSQPDWATLTIDYSGPQLDRSALLEYIVSFRNHCEFHEQCVERIFIDLMTQTSPRRLSVTARYTRRGGLDINPWRATVNENRMEFVRDVRQ